MYIYNYITDGKDGVEAVHDILKDHGDACPPDPVQLILFHFQKVLSLKQDFSAGDTPLTVQEAQDGQRGDAFPASAFANHAQDFPAAHAERYVRSGPAAGMSLHKVNLQMSDFQKLLRNPHLPGSVMLTEGTCHTPQGAWQVSVNYWISQS